MKGGYFTIGSLDGTQQRLPWQSHVNPGHMRYTRTPERNCTEISTRILLENHLCILTGYLTYAEVD